MNEKVEAQNQALSQLHRIADEKGFITVDDMLNSTLSALALFFTTAFAAAVVYSYYFPNTGSSKRGITDGMNGTGYSDQSVHDL